MRPKPFFLKSILANDRFKRFVWYLSIIGVLGMSAWLFRDFRWHVVWESGPYLLRGIGNSWILSLVAISAGLLAGILLAAARLYGPLGVRHLAVGFIEIVRAVPQLMVIFWVFFTYPGLTGRSLNAWSAALLALSMISAAYLAEVVRAGLTSVQLSQTESAYVTGLSPRQTFIYIVLPQALRNMVPAFIATFVMIFKVTSLVYVIGMIDFFRSVIIVNNRDLAPFALYTTMAVIYFLCCFILSVVVRKLDPKYDITTF